MEKPDSLVEALFKEEWLLVEGAWWGLVEKSRETAPTTGHVFRPFPTKAPKLGRAAKSLTKVPCVMLLAVPRDLSH